VRFKQSTDERDPVWQQNVLRNAMTGSVTVRLQPGEHVLRLFGTDPSVVVQQIVLIATAQPTSKPAARLKAWGDQGDGTFVNTILPADHSDPDAIRGGVFTYNDAGDARFLDVDEFRYKYAHAARRYDGAMK